VSNRVRGERRWQHFQSIGVAKLLAPENDPASITYDVGTEAAAAAAGAVQDRVTAEPDTEPVRFAGAPGGDGGCGCRRWVRSRRRCAASRSGWSDVQEPIRQRACLSVRIRYDDVDRSRRVGGSHSRQRRRRGDHDIRRRHTADGHRQADQEVRAVDGHGRAAKRRTEIRQETRDGWGRASAV